MFPLAFMLGACTSLCCPLVEAFVCVHYLKVIVIDCPGRHMIAFLSKSSESLVFTSNGLGCTDCCQTSRAENVRGLPEWYCKTERNEIICSSNVLSESLMKLHPDLIAESHLGMSLFSSQSGQSAPKSTSSYMISDWKREHTQ